MVHVQQKKSISLLLLILLTGLPQLSETIYTPSLPDIVNSLSTTDALVQWTLSIYFVGFAVGVFTWGKFADRNGRRPALLLGMALYSMASLVCFFSQNIYFLLAARFFQAYGVSTGSVVTQTIARDVYTPEKRAQVFALIVGCLALTPAIGPFIGGIVTQYADWNYNFLVLVILGTLIGLITYAKLPETHPNSNGTERATHKSAEVALRMLADSRILTFGFLVGTFNGLLFSFYSEAPFIFVNKLNMSYSSYGRLGIFLALASFLSAITCKRLAKRLSAETMIKNGCLFASFSALLFVLFAAKGWITPHNGMVSILLVLLPTMGIFAAFSMVIPFALSQALENYSECLGTAGAVFGLGYYCLVSLITFGMGAIHNGYIITMPLYFLILTVMMLGSSVYYYKANKSVMIKN